MQLKSSIFKAGEQLTGFYGSVIPKGEKLFPVNREDIGIQHKGSKHYRFVFQTIREGEAHDFPIGNKRVCIWYTGGEFEANISPL